MQPIITQEHKGKKEKRNRIIIGIILVGVMLLSTAGYAFFGGEKSNVEKLDYKGIKFSLGDDGLWHFLIQEQEFATTNNPKETENISSNINLKINDYSQKVLYFSQDSDNQGLQEIARNIERFTTRMWKACLDNCSEDLPIKNCSENIIIIRESSESLIKQEENCVYILFNENDAIRASDAFIFKILGI